MTPMNLLVLFGLSVLITIVYQLFYVLGAKSRTTFIKGWVIPTMLTFTVLVFAFWVSDTDTYKTFADFMNTTRLW
jgi:hypothetical protein